MRLSRYFLPVLKENPSEAQIVSHRLMLRAGMIKQSAAGIYSWLPLGFKVLRKIETIVHEEQQRSKIETPRYFVDAAPQHRSTNTCMHKQQTYLGTATATEEAHHQRLPARTIISLDQNKDYLVYTH